MISPFLSLFFFMQLASPIDDALLATEAPKSLRIAFEVELSSESATHVYSFDPRLDEGKRWQVVSHSGEDAYLDEVAANWAAESAPDGRLFPDDLRASLGADVQTEKLGEAWKLRFRHAPSANDNTFDVWAAEQLMATAWLSPIDGRFIRIDYELPRSARLPGGGRLTRYDQTYFLEEDPVYRFSLITSFKVDLEARGGFRRERRSYKMHARNIEVFFASAEAEAQYFAALTPLEADGKNAIR